MLIVVEWCRILSRIAVAITGSPKISFRWKRLRLEVRISAPFSYFLCFGINSFEKATIRFPARSWAGLTIRALSQGGPDGDRSASEVTDGARSEGREAGALGGQGGDGREDSAEVSAHRVATGQNPLSY